MKHTLALLISVLSITSKAQTLSDALLYADDNIYGTARFSAMSGAFGALGGDFSSIHVNPAGSAVFNNNQVAITLSSLNTKNQSNYFGNKVNSNDNSFDVNQAGGILVFNNYDEKSKWKKIALAADYENIRNFNNSIISSGNNPNQSVADYFLSYANPGLYGSNIPLGVIDTQDFQSNDFRTQQAFLGYQSFIIDSETNNPNNNIYKSNVSPGDFSQENYSEITGYNGKMAFNLSAQYTDRYYFGFSLNTYFTNITYSSLFVEKNDNNNTENVNSIDFENDNQVYGNGYSFQFGTIVKVDKSIRLGLAYESPTWYQLEQERRQYVNTESVGLPNSGSGFSFLELNPESFKLKTPSKWTGSLAYIFGKNGLISIDYSLKDYSKIEYRTYNSYYRSINAAANNLLKTSGELRIGAEYRHKLWSFRGGYRYEQSPYENKRIMGDLTGFSTGFGYNFGNTKLDLSYSYAQRKSQEAVFSQGFTAPQNLKTQFNNISATILFEL